MLFYIAVYEESGVQEYWLISPQDKTFLKYTLINGQYQPSRLLTTGDITITPILPGFELNLETIFALPAFNLKLSANCPLKTVH